MVYNLTQVMGTGNETGLVTFVQGVNDVIMMGWLGTIFLIGIFLVIFISIIFATNDVGKALITSSFICFTLAIPLVGLGLAPPLTLIITILLTGGIVAITWPKN